jgi:HEAT repeat protein
MPGMLQVSLRSLCVLLLVATTASAQREGFIKVDGPNLKSRIEAAIKQARTNATATPFWAAYSFDVRPGVGVDLEFGDGKYYISDGSITIGLSTGSGVETRNLGVFLLHEPESNAITRIEVYNLDRKREYSRYPVYWLGRAGNEESLSYLKSFALSEQLNKLPERATMAIGLHDDPQVAALLKDLIRNSKREQVRSSSVFWLGQAGGEHQFLADLVRNDRESMEIRKKAAHAIGESREAVALPILQSLYNSVPSREIKRHIIFAISINENSGQAIDFLIKVADSDPDMELKKQALFWLGHKAGDRSLKVLGDVVNSSDAETEIQKQAVLSISRRPKDEAIPLLIKIARTHPKAEVRKQAIMSLGRTGDERALEFFKELLTK